MAKAIRIHAPGGAEALQYEDVFVPAPSAGEVLVRQTAIGVNYIDVYYRTGLYALPAYPAIPGLEGCGVVEALGDRVNGLQIGDRVAYAGGPLGAYTESRVIPASFLVKLPNNISDTQAAAVMVQGLTAQFLVRRTFPLREEHICLVHAAAGGVGLLLCQWAKHLGATVIGTTSSDEKAAIAKANGCDHVIIYTRENVVERVRALTVGKGVHVVYDSVGKDTFMASLDCLQPLGMMVSFGQASGKIPPFDISLLVQKGSLFLTRPSMVDYFRDPEVYRQGAEELLDMVAQGKLHIHIGQTYSLADAAKAHQDLESRRTQGASVLLT